MLEHVIFSVDNINNLYKYQQAIHQLDVIRNMKMSGAVHMLMGSYMGKLEPSFMVTKMDWDNHVKSGMSQFMQDQECVLHVPGDQRQPCVLRSLDGRFIESVGKMVPLSAYEALMYDGWTYNLATNQYYTCEELRNV